MGDPLYDEYFIDTRTLGGLVKASPLYGNQQIKDAIFNIHTVAEAFALALTEPYLTPAINEQLPHGVAPLAWEIARGCYIQFAVTGAAAAIGAIVGGVGGSVTLPIVGTVAGIGAGAALGASIAGWVLFGAGLPAMVKSASDFSHDCSDKLQAGLEMALKGDKEGAAQKIAAFFAELLSYLVPVIILALVAKASKVAAGSFAKLPAMRNWAAAIKWLELNDMKLASEKLGLTGGEIKNFSKVSMKKMIVVRGCNPLRLKYITEGYHSAETLPVVQGLVHAKPVYMKWHTSHAGPYAGQVVITEEERFQIASMTYKDTSLPVPKDLPVYKITPVPEGKFGLRRLYKIEARDEILGARHKLELDGHYLEEFLGPEEKKIRVVDPDGKVRVMDDPEHVTMVKQYRIVHPDGKGFVGDIDRAAYAEFDIFRGILTPGKFGRAMHWKPNDDPREIAFMNEQIRQELQDPVNYNVFQHGNANQNWVRDPLRPGKLMLGWPSRDPLTFKYNFNEDEPLLFAIDGRTFVINWEQFGAFCKLFKSYSTLFPWDN